MTPRTHLEALRRSVLGAWLACAYALAVLASALSPASATATAMPGQLCSGEMAQPGPGEPADGEGPHCKPCLPLPGLAVLPPVPALAARIATLPLRGTVSFTLAEPRPARNALAQPRAPPVTT